MKKSLIIGVVIVVVLFGAYLGFTGFGKKQTVNTPQFNLTTVERGDIAVKVSGTGVVVAKYREEVKVTTAGTVKEVLFEEGDKVEEGKDLVDFSGYVASLEAPISGSVAKIAVKEDDLVTPGQVVAEVVNYDKLQLKIEVDELDISKVKLGQSADISVAAFPEESFTGKVIEIAKEGVVNNGVATFSVVLEIAEAKELRIGMTADATILVEEKDQVLLVPVEGVQSKEGKHFATVEVAAAAKEDKADKSQEPKTKLKPIEVGIHNEDYIEIMSGLSEGEKIVLPTLGSSEDDDSRGFPGMGMRSRDSNRDAEGARGDSQ